MEIRYIILVAIVYILSVDITHIGMAQQDTDPLGTDPLKIIIRDKSLGYDKDSNKQIVSINITTNKIGHFIYREKYYTVNSTGYLIFVSNATHYDNKLVDNNITFQIARPITKSGKLYPFIKSVVTVNDQTASAWIKKSNITVNNNNTINSTRNNGTINRPDTVNDKKVPGFEIITFVVTISMAYLLIRKKI